MAARDELLRRCRKYTQKTFAARALAAHEEVTARLGTSVGLNRKLRELYKETDGITCRPHGGGMPRKLTPDDEKAFRRWCEGQPRLRTERGVEISTMSLRRVLREMNPTRKNPLCDRATDAEVRLERTCLVKLIRRFCASRFGYLNEFDCNMAMTCR